MFLDDVALPCFLEEALRRVRGLLSTPKIARICGAAGLQISLLRVISIPSTTCPRSSIQRLFLATVGVLWKWVTQLQPNVVPEP